MDLSEQLSTILGGRFKQNEPLAHHTTFKVGGVARYYYTAESLEDLKNAIAVAKNLGVKWFILGSGSNIVFSDSGFDGLVIKNNARQFELRGMRGKIEKGKLVYSKTQLYAESGAFLNQIIRFSVENAFSGLEYFIGMPGTVGGAIFTKASYEGFSIGDHIAKISVLGKNGDIAELSWQPQTAEQEKAGLDKAGDAVLAVTFDLQPKDKTLLWNIAERMLQERQKDHPEGILCTGDVFFDIALSDAMRAATPNQTQSVTTLLEYTDILKEQGNVTVLEQHPNSLVLRNPTANDIYNFTRKMKETVKRKYTITVKPRIQFVGEFT